MILVSNGFAELSKFTISKENYEFKAHIHMNSETIVTGKKAKIIMTPKLTLNKRPVSLSHLKHADLDVTVITGGGNH